MSEQPDFTGDPPDYWWSEMEPEALRAELASHFNRSFPEAEIVRAWTEEDEGPAFAELADGRRFRFVGDGNVIVWEEIAA